MTPRNHVVYGYTMITDAELKTMTIIQRNMTLDAIAHEEWLCEMEMRALQDEYTNTIRF